MKKIIAIIVSLAFAVSLCACGGTGNEKTDDNTKTETAAVIEKTEAANDQSQAETTEADTDDPLAEDMAALEGIGDIEVSEGIVYVYVTIPASLANGVTQADIDEKAGETYQSGKLNEDGSITYKMTRKQHQAMLDSTASAFDDACKDMLEDTDTYGITAIDHNDDFTVIKVTMNSDTVGLGASFAVLAFYMYGGMYGIVSGHKVDNITVEFYAPDGSLIQTANSSEAGY